MNEIRDRFVSSATGAVPFDEQRAAARVLTEAHADLAELVAELAPAGRWQALALTALEEALMWANKAVLNKEAR